VSDAKEWKTVKVEEAVRDEARDDPRTYTEIMRAGLDETPADTGGVDADAIADTVAERVGATLSEVTWEQLDAADLAQQTAAYVEQRSNVTLEASERRAIAQEVAEELQR
jgi:hypothetical protein